MAAVMYRTISLWLTSITVLRIAAFAPKSVLHIRQESYFARTRLAVAPGLVDSKIQIKDTSSIKFDISLAIILAGYSFEAYNEPVLDTISCRPLICDISPDVSSIFGNSLCSNSSFSLS